MKRLLLTILCYLLAFSSVWAAGKIRMIVEAGSYDRTDCVVSADVSVMNRNTDLSEVVLFEKNGRKKTKVPCQLLAEKGGKTFLYWILSGKTPAGTTREFVAEPSKKEEQSFVMKTGDTGSALVLKKNDSEILQYNYATVYPPTGVDSSFRRSGFIHPACAPSGNILTTIQPKDHYHHYGIWNPWTRIEYGAEMYDLWNLGDKKGTVRSRNIDTVYEGNICAGYVANLDHYIFTSSGEKVIMNESWTVKSWNVPEHFLWDFESGLHPATDLPVLIKAYRYAGFGWRATEEWTKDNCIMITSEGKNRTEIDGTTARWIFVTGTCSGNERSGFLLLGHPANYSAPEPLRIWDEKANGGRGDAFVNFAPTKNKDWQLKPDNDYFLRYRICTYDGEMTAAEANRLWNDFAYPPKVIIK